MMKNILYDWKSHQINPARKRICIVVPHPDDFDLLVGHTAQLFLQRDWQVYEILMTFGEYGVVNRFGDKANQLKGKFLQRLRTIENSRSKTSYGTFSDGTPRVLTIPMGFFDGHVPFNNNSVSKLQNVFRHIQPSVIIGPDPVYSIDWHIDHMATARNCFFAVVNLPPKERPKKFFLFQTFRANWHWPIQSWNVFIQANLYHRSQMSPLLIQLMASALKTLYVLFRKNKTGLRTIDLHQEKGKLIEINRFSYLSDWLFYALLFGNKPNPSLYSPSPQDLGLI
jgi:LmbE family N-acetylglucosaminyl deacetylase